MRLSSTLSRRIALVLLAIVVISAFVDITEAKRSKKKKASKPKQSSDSENSDENEQGKVKSKKKWSEWTDDDFNKLEDEFTDPEDRWKPPEPPKMKFDPKNPGAFMAAQKAGKPAMMFSTLTKNSEGKVRNKKQTEEVAFKWKNLMQSNALDASPYVIEDGKILWTVMDGMKGYKVLDFCLKQEEMVEMEWDNQKYHPGVPYMKP